MDVLGILDQERTDILDSAYAGADTNTINEMFEVHLGLIENAKDSNLLVGDNYTAEKTKLRQVRQKAIFLSKVPEFNDLGLVTMRQIKSAINSNGATTNKIVVEGDEETTQKLREAVTQVLTSGTASGSSKFIPVVDNKELSTWLDSYISDANAIQTEQLQQEQITNTTNYSTIHAPNMNKFNDNFVTNNIQLLNNSSDPIAQFEQNNEVLATERLSRSGLAEDRKIPQTDVDEIDIYKQANALTFLSKVFNKDMTQEKWMQIKESITSNKPFPNWMDDNQVKAMKVFKDSGVYDAAKDYSAYNSFFNGNGSTASILQTAEDSRNEKARLGAIPNNNVASNAWESNYSKSENIGSSFSEDTVIELSKQLDEQQKLVNGQYTAEGGAQIDFSRTQLDGVRRTKTSQLISQILPNISEMKQTEWSAVEIYLRDGTVVEAHKEFINGIKGNLDILVKHGMYKRGVDDEAFKSWFNSRGVDSSQFNAEKDKAKAEEDATNATEITTQIITGAYDGFNQGEIRSQIVSDNNNGSSTLPVDLLEKGFNKANELTTAKNITPTTKATGTANVISSVFNGYMQGLRSGNSTMKDAEGNVVEFDSRVANGFKVALDTSGGNMSGVPASHREQFRTMIELSNQNNPNAITAVAGDIKTLVQELKQEEEGNKKILKAQQAGQIVESGNFGSTMFGAEVSDQKAYVNQKVATATNNDTNYFLNPDSLPSENMPKGTAEVYRFARELHVIPEAFSNTMNKLANGTLPQEAAGVAIQHYANLRNAIDPNSGYTINYLSIVEGGTAMDSKTIAKLDNVLAIMDVENITATAAINRLNEVDDTAKGLNTTAFQADMRESLGKENEPYSIQDYLIDNFEGNVNVASQMLPYATVMIENGMPFHQLDAKLDDFYNTQYGETQSYVVDYSSGYGNRSRAALSMTVGSGNIEGFVEEVDDLLSMDGVFAPSTGTGGTFRLSKEVTLGAESQDTFYEDMTGFLVSPSMAILTREKRKAEAIAQERALAVSDNGQERKAVLVPIRYSNNKVMYRVMGLLRINLFLFIEPKKMRMEENRLCQLWFALKEICVIKASLQIQKIS